MAKNELIFIEEKDKITIKQKSNLAHFIIFATIIATIFAAAILFFVLFGETKTIPILLIACVCILGNIALFALPSFEKIVIDLDKKEFSIRKLRTKTYRFNEVIAINSFFEEGDYESFNEHKIVFLFYNGYDVFHTTSKEQTDELVKMLTPIFTDTE